MNIEGLHPQDHTGDARQDPALYEVPEQKPLPKKREPEQAQKDMMSGSPHTPGSPEWFAELKRKLDSKKK